LKRQFQIKKEDKIKLMEEKIKEVYEKEIMQNRIQN
jgi:uncharacterized protein YqgQ